MKLIGEDVEALEVFFAHTLAPITTGTIVSIILIIYYLQYNLLLALIAIIVYFTLAVIIPNLFSNKLKPLLEVQQKYRKSYTSYFLESLRGMKDLLQLGVEKERFKNLSKESRIVNKRKKCCKIKFFTIFIQFFNNRFRCFGFCFCRFYTCK